ncbi:hypothetical protein TIFTF001_042200 [Ficus carica]|uniref:Uncharacterized protein n=1 Tax=Ficus carica TaxID=3494 RepID=A0AA88CYA9_FICCA|nr:hypothetical protein TIFTF001_042200 [Ficus carica]
MILRTSSLISGSSQSSSVNQSCCVSGFGAVCNCGGGTVFCVGVNSIFPWLLGELKWIFSKGAELEFFLIGGDFWIVDFIKNPFDLLGIFCWKVIPLGVFFWFGPDVIRDDLVFNEESLFYFPEIRTTKRERVVVRSIEFNGWSIACFVTYLSAVKAEEEDGVALILSGANHERRFIWDLYGPVESGWYRKLLIEASSGTVWTSMAMVKKLVRYQKKWVNGFGIYRASRRGNILAKGYVGWKWRVIFVASFGKVGGKIATRSEAPSSGRRCRSSTKKARIASVPRLSEIVASYLLLAGRRSSPFTKHRSSQRESRARLILWQVSAALSDSPVVIDSDDLRALCSPGASPSSPVTATAPVASGCFGPALFVIPAQIAAQARKSSYQPVLHMHQLRPANPAATPARVTSGLCFSSPQSQPFIS